MVTPPFRLTPLLRRGLLTCTIFLVSLSALAGDISFRLSLSGSTLTVTLLGESPAFYPTVLHMLPDGRWEPLAPKSGSPLPAELLPGKDYQLEWPDTRPLQSLTPFERLQPVMVRYFEQDGVSFGQISFFHPPPPATAPLQAGYSDGLLMVSPPAVNRAPSDTAHAIRATWVLWPQEEGIAPLHQALSFEHVQPAAQRIEWQPGANAIQFNTGKGQPEAILLHESAQGYVLQTLLGSGLQGRQQRADWLEANSKFYGIALLAALAAVIALLLYRVRVARENPPR